MTDAERMMSLFEGFRSAHGTHGDTNSVSGEKVEIKKTARTLREPVTLELWKEHLTGKRALGVIPINEESKCRWGCLDIDDYSLDFKNLMKDIKTNEFPLVVCRSKSGGAHVFLFLKEFESASNVQDVLKKIASHLGCSGCEVFPKQREVLSERQDLGSWLNMPFMKDTRLAVAPDGVRSLSLKKFLDLAEKTQTTTESIKFPSKKKDGDFTDGPPCLEVMMKRGFPKGSRNKSLFATAIYLKKKHPESWEDELDAMNRKIFENPLPSEEVNSMRSSLKKKDYHYLCQESPFCDFCDSSLCQTRAFGVGAGANVPRISGLAKLDSEPAIWFLDIDGHRVELSSRDILNFRSVQEVCLEKLNIVFGSVKPAVWTSLLAKAMEDVQILEASQEMSVMGEFREHLNDFLFDRHRAERIEDLLTGRPFHSEEEGIHLFRLKDLMVHLSRVRFTHWGRSKIGHLIDEMGGRETRRIGRSQVRLFFVKDDQLDGAPEPAPLPDAPESEI